MSFSAFELADFFDSFHFKLDNYLKMLNLNYKLLLQLQIAFIIIFERIITLQYFKQKLQRPLKLQNNQMDPTDFQNYQYGKDNEPQQQQNYDYDYDYGQNQQIQEGQNYDSYEDCSYESGVSYSHTKQYQVLPYNSLLSELWKSVKTAEEMTALPQGWCLLLLRQFKWQVESMSEYFHNTELYKSRIAYKQNYKTTNEEYLSKGLCEVCCQENHLLRNICGHGFCVDCWKGQIQNSLFMNTPFIKCMGCQCPVLHQTLLKFMSICFTEDHKLLDRYEKILCELFSSVHRNYQFCTGVDCNNCIKVNNLNLQTVRCTCGKAFCFKCKSDDHSPCTCQQKQTWLSNVLKEEADAKWMSVHTKLCPWCKKAVERSAGCNFMACICGKSFCFLCSRPWQPDHKDHFKCHIYKKSQNEFANRQKDILEKMNFYTERFLYNQTVGNETMKIQTYEKRKFLFKTLKIDLSESQFIESAFKFAVECSQSLKWIYAYSYYVKWKDAIEKQNFEFFQGQFQLYKANLMKILAVDLKKFFQKIKQHQMADTLSNVNNLQGLIQSFRAIKASIVNYSTMTKKYKEKFIQEIEKRAQIQDPVIKKKPSQSKVQIAIQKKQPQIPKVTIGTIGTINKIKRYFTKY